MILNLTMHSATQDQVKDGVVDLKGESLKNLKDLLNFDALPSFDEVEDRAVAISSLAEKIGAKTCMIGGAPFLMFYLHKSLLDRHITPVYAFSLRESVETVLPDGTVKKTNVFKHKGFV